jgi:probable rRNA maturation factor
VALRPGAELCIHLADDAHIRQLNARWRGLDKATNVLSFPAADAARIEEARLLGDIVLAFETVAREAEAEGKPIVDHYRHLVVHGFLHLIGFDHERDDEAQRMEAMETRILARLGVADPYRAGELADAVL